ncbi:uncharacterized protein MKK02DRAFT_32221 [Dioszegia hungarica]|uniref:NmrA-like domain-containing protein n=1 Tax=Dioszegia hungarica TaxID=4972 RepID=A0AA38LW80_9TREE|nr:uncharacterized protein MKK02DRAFT_32221 [Dioszegia hungarica]KAI9637348.1 hypothetical protein MKK02DRAFT_32221 [Dioszegia hungarica]
MSSPRANTIAILGPRGWVASAVISALAATPSHIKAIYRQGSSPGDLPSSVEGIEVDWADESAFLAALQGVVIVLSLVGQAGLAEQLRLVPMLRRASISLFIPSDFAYVHTKEDDKIPVIHNKEVLATALNEAGVPMLTVLAGNFAEFALNTPRIGVDMINNRIVHTGHTDTQRINLCTRAYVAAALAALLPSTPSDKLKGRTIGLNEFSPTGAEIASAMERRSGAPPRVARATDERSLRLIDKGSPWALAESVKLKWSRGEHSVGEDMYDVKGYSKVGLEELVVKGQLVKYRPLPFDFATVLDEYFE